MGPVSAVAIDGQDRVFVLHRHMPPVLCFGREGEFLFAWGEDVIRSGHGLRIDAQGFVWVTDISQHQVFKFTSEGRLVLSVGTKGKAGAEPDQFNQPTDVAVSPAGDLFVSDGYGNSRIVQFSADGEFIRSWGRKGREAGEFDTPHALVLNVGGKLHVSDRGNSRVQIFDQEGNYLAEWRGLPAFDGLYCALDDTIFGATGRGNEILRIGPAGVVLESYGGPRSTQAELENHFVPPPGRFNVAHGVSVDRYGDIYVAEIRSRRIQKLVRQEIH